MPSQPSSNSSPTSSLRHYLILQAHNPIFSSFPSNATLPYLWNTAKDLNADMEMVRCMDGSYWVEVCGASTGGERQKAARTGHTTMMHQEQQHSAQEQQHSAHDQTLTQIQLSHYSVQCKHYDPNIFIASFVGVREPVELPPSANSVPHNEPESLTESPSDNDSLDDDPLSFFTQPPDDASTQLPFAHTNYDSHQSATIQMDLIFRLLSMRTDFSKRSVFRGYTMNAHERSCLDYIVKEEWTSQAMRLGCWEAVDLSNENSARTRDQITKLLGVAAKCKSIIHSLLICQKKIVSMWSRSDKHILQPTDVLLLIIESEVRRTQWNKDYKQWRRSQRKWECARREEKQKSAKEMAGEQNGSATEQSGEPESDNLDNKPSQSEPDLMEEADDTTSDAPPHQDTTNEQPSNSSSPPQEEPLFDTFEILRLKGNSGDYIQPLCVYIARISDSMTLIFIGIRDDDDQSQLEYRSLKNVMAKNLNRSYADFITITATHHLMTERYLHICPGLIHFIFKDCVRKRVLAPVIISLQRDPRAKSSSNNIEIDEKFIRHHVWKMCQTVDQYRELGQYTEMNVCTRSAQYCFTEWFVDKNGTTIAATEGNLKDAVEHYELYTMYLPYVSLQAIQAYNKELAKRLVS